MCGEKFIEKMTGGILAALTNDTLSNNVKEDPKMKKVALLACTALTVACYLPVLVLLPSKVLIARRLRAAISRRGLKSPRLMEVVLTPPAAVVASNYQHSPHKSNSRLVLLIQDDDLTRHGRRVFYCPLDLG